MNLETIYEQKLTYMAPIPGVEWMFILLSHQISVTHTKDAI